VNLVGLTDLSFRCNQAKWTCEREVGARRKSCDACFHKKQKCEGAIWSTVDGELSGAAAAHGGGLGHVGEAILHELRMLREALGELKGLNSV
jgi:hypothetical protein